MFKETFVPRFSETDALGHINNTVLPVWFEAARNPVFALFTPEMDLKKWPLILAKFSVEFHSELFYGKDIELRTYISRLGNSSFDVYQEAWQDNKKCASGTTTMVHYDFEEGRSKAISSDVKAILENHNVAQD